MGAWWLVAYNMAWAFVGDLVVALVSWSCISMCTSLVMILFSLLISDSHLGWLSWLNPWRRTSGAMRHCIVLVSFGGNEGGVSIFPRRRGGTARAGGLS